MDVALQALIFLKYLMENEQQNQKILWFRFFFDLFTRLNFERNKIISSILGLREKASHRIAHCQS